MAGRRLKLQYMRLPRGRFLWCVHSGGMGKGMVDLGMPAMAIQDVVNEVVEDLNKYLHRLLPYNCAHKKVPHCTKAPKYKKHHGTTP